jgi:hypothetical protein
MKYRINTETKEFIEDKGNLGNFFFQAPWRKATTSEINTWQLQEAKSAKIKEINDARDLIDTKPFVYYANSSTPAYELAVNEFGQVVKTDNNVSFVFDAKPVSIPIRTPSEILNDVKEEYDNGRVDYYLPYSCDIVDQNGAFLRKGGVAIDMKLRNAIRNHLKHRAMNNTFIARSLKNAVFNATSIEEVNSINYHLNSNDTRFE